MWRQCEGDGAWRRTRKAGFWTSPRTSVPVIAGRLAGYSSVDIGRGLMGGAGVPGCGVAVAEALRAVRESTDRRQLGLCLDPAEAS